MNMLSEETKLVAERLILNFINNWGLEARAKQQPEKIEFDNKNQKFILYLKRDSFSYLYLDGSIG